MMQMLEDTLIEHAHTKPLLPSQLIRYREVQVPDGKCWVLVLSSMHITHTLYTSSQQDMHVTLSSSIS